MSSTDYNYDDQGQFFPYFLATLAAIFTIPITYSVLKPSKELENTAPRIESSYKPEEADLVDKQRRKQKRRELKLKRIIIAGLGWLLIGWMVYLMIVTVRQTPKIWDPYEILGLSRSANEKQIKSHYRKLSITHHPDKRRPDALRNETSQTVNDDWVEMTKAFKTLTDEDIRNNYIQYGHPDGKQSFSIGIALPKFLITEGNGKYVLVFYGALLGIVLPYLVGTWWWGTQSKTKENVLVSSAGRLFKEYQEDLTEGGVIAAISNGEEFEESLKDAQSLDSVSKNVSLADSTTFSMSAADRRNLQYNASETKGKALSLLWAYLGRLDLGDAALNELKFEVAPIAQVLNGAWLTMLPLWGTTQPLLSSYHATQSLIQAIPPNASPLLQLPYFTPKLVRKIEAQLNEKNMTVQAFMALPEHRRREIVVSQDGLSQDAYNTAVQVASQLPYAKVEKAFFKVTGEKHLTPGSLLVFVVKLRFIPPGSTNVPAVDPKDLEDVDAAEGDLDALHGRRKTDDVPTQAPLAHAPYFARDHAPNWHIFLAENKSGKIAVPPFKFEKFNKPIFNEDGTPTFNMQTLRMQFQAPPQAAEFPFTMHLICDSYVGLDSKVDVVMKVEDVSQVEEIEEDDDISEPEEDSIAGQMQAMKGGSKSTRRRIVEVDDSSGSDTEGDDETDSDTDTDTDTDEE